MSMPNDEEIRRTLDQGIALVRAGRLADALPLLEPAIDSGRFPFAPMIRDFAAFRMDGRDLATVTCGGDSFRFRIGGDNLGLEIFHVAGRFFEAEELHHCRSRVPAGGTIVDVGANTGNHSVFFGHYLRPARLVPVEPNPVAVRTLTDNLTLNAIAADTRGYGLAVGQVDATARLDTRRRDLVVGRLAPGEGVRVVPLDGLVDGAVDLIKIDVEGMEPAVLAGAGRIIAQSRPFILVEIHPRTWGMIQAFCARHAYTVEKRFAAFGYTNAFLCPDERRR